MLAGTSCARRSFSASGDAGARSCAAISRCFFRIAASNASTSGEPAFGTSVFAAAFAGFAGSAASAAFVFAAFAFAGFASSSAFAAFAAPADDTSA
ncbi:hypothetical protein [Nannocystis pusilla]|uniref:hypothetical protein n=1 Tax=Nannocystis pusilla TaxID=889268 RepID=UPI003DA34F6C